ncbi:MAG: SRPBCC family protein [Marinomonas sp.]
MYSLTISQEFNASVETLFNAWTTPEVISQWFAPGNMTVPEASVDFKVGGAYRFVMQNQEGEQFIVGGEYKEIAKPEKLVFSWQWESSPHTTTVTVLFTALTDNKSKLELIHTEFQEQEYCDKHNEGWLGCLANLPRALS